MLPDLKEWEADLPQRAPKLLVVSTGTLENNIAMGLHSPVLVDEEGKVASELAVGAPEVLALAGASQSGV